MGYSCVDIYILRLKIKTRFFIHKSMIPRYIQEGQRSYRLSLIRSDNFHTQIYDPTQHIRRRYILQAECHQIRQFSHTNLWSHTTYTKGERSYKPSVIRSYSFHTQIYGPTLHIQRREILQVEYHQIKQFSHTNPWSHSTYMKERDLTSPMSLHQIVSSTNL